MLPKLKRGKLLDIVLACLLKNPVFLVENEGYPLTSSVLAFALAHVTLPLLLTPPFVYRSGYAFLGEDLPPIDPNSLLKPGLAQPPPARGEGDRDNDISVDAALGMVESRPEPPRPLRPDVAPMSRLEILSSSSLAGYCFVLEDLRRRCC